MKTKGIQLLAASFLAVIVACNNQTTEEKKPEQGNSTTVKTETKTAEPKKTEVTVGPDGAEVKTKTGEEVKVSQSGGTVGTKDVKVKVNTKDTTKK